MSVARKKVLYLSEKIKREILSISNSDANLLIDGESGVGKDVVAKYIHENSKRCNRDIIAINISAIPEDLLEKELFGSVAGAFTGAEKNIEGKFIQADNSTLVLDEIGELPTRLQSKLIRFIEHGEFEPVGSNRKFKVDCRIIAITNRDLGKMVKEGLFREDLYYRLNVLNLTIPPLRERLEFIKAISNDYINEFKDKESDITLTNDALEKIINYDWPGNLRELKNSIERAVVLCNKSEISSQYLLLSSDNNGKITRLTLKEAVKDFKRNYILKVLESNDWNITKSAKVLDVQRTYLSRLIKELYRE